MKSIIHNINLFFESLHQKLQKYKYLILIVIIIFTALLAAGMEKVIIDESIEAYLRDDDPVKIAYNHFRSYFGSDEYVYVVYRAKDKDIFSDNSLKTLKQVHDELVNYRLGKTFNEKLPLDHIKEVKSLINVKYMESHDDTLFSRNFVGDKLPADSKQREILRNKGLNHPDYPHLYLSQNSEYGGIIIRTDFNAETVDVQETNNSLSEFDDDMEEFFSEDDEIVNNPGSEEKKFQLKKTDIQEYPAFVNALNSIFEKPEYSKVFNFYPVGNPIIMHFFAIAVMADMSRLMGYVLILIICLLFILFRSFCAVLWPIIIVTLTIIWTIGIIGWSGIPSSAMIQVVVFLALSVGIADTVHILSGYLFFRNHGQNHNDAINSVMKKSGLACFLTSATTSVGLISLVLVPLKPISNFGIFASVAVLLAFLFTVILLPLMLDIWSPVSKIKKVQTEHFVLRIIKKIENVSIVKSKLIVFIFSIVGIVLLYGLSQLKVDSNFVEVIKETLPLRKAYTVVDNHMGGTSNMEIMLSFNKEDALKNPEILFCMQAIQEYMQHEHENKVIKTMSLVNVVKESYKALNNDDPKKYIIPSDPNILKQVLFLFSNANPDDRRRLVSDDYSRGRIGVNALNVSSTEALKIIDSIQLFIDNQFQPLKEKYPDLKVIVTGNMALLAIMLDYVSWSQIKSFSMALGIISIILLIVLGSWKAGAVSLVPNLFPILASFGLMGFFKIPLDADTLIIAPIIMGLAVDDTIHFMTHFRLEMNKYNNVAKAAIYSIREAGQAITFTSIILSTSFLVFLLSFHNGLSHFGIFSAIAIMTALISDLFLLPALCQIIHVDFKDNNKNRRKL
ncbi:RND transporter [Candidatus Magnetomorum sp. HK-1]|nr:RND transporter [Candidatus Magnetomorum sp. HK-1]